MPPKNVQGGQGGRNVRTGVIQRSKFKGDIVGFKLGTAATDGRCVVTYVEAGSEVQRIGITVGTSVVSIFGMRTPNSKVGIQAILDFKKSGKNECTIEFVPNSASPVIPQQPVSMSPTGTTTRSVRKADFKDGKLGVGFKDRDGGVVVSLLPAGSPAERAGMRMGDRVLSVDTTAVSSVAQVTALLNTFKASARAAVVFETIPSSTSPAPAYPSPAPLANSVHFSPEPDVKIASPETTQTQLSSIPHGASPVSQTSSVTQEAAPLPALPSPMEQSTHSVHSVHSAHSAPSAHLSETAGSITTRNESPSVDMVSLRRVGSPFQWVRMESEGRGMVDVSVGVIQGIGVVLLAANEGVAKTKAKADILRVVPFHAITQFSHIVDNTEIAVDDLFGTSATSLRADSPTHDPVDFPSDPSRNDLMAIHTASEVVFLKGRGCHVEEVSAELLAKVRLETSHAILSRTYHLHPSDSERKPLYDALQEIRMLLSFRGNMVPIVKTVPTSWLAEGSSLGLVCKHSVGVLSVVSVAKGSVGERAGVVAGSIITKIDGKAVVKNADVRAALARAKAEGRSHIDIDLMATEPPKEKVVYVTPPPPQLRFGLDHAAVVYAPQPAVDSQYKAKLVGQLCKGITKHCGERFALLSASREIGSKTTTLNKHDVTEGVGKVVNAAIAACADDADEAGAHPVHVVLYLIGEHDEFSGGLVVSDGVVTFEMLSALLQRAPPALHVTVVCDNGGCLAFGYESFNATPAPRCKVTVLGTSVPAHGRVPAAVPTTSLSSAHCAAQIFDVSTETLSYMRSVLPVGDDTRLLVATSHPFDVPKDACGQVHVSGVWQKVEFVSLWRTEEPGLKPWLEAFYQAYNDMRATEVVGTADPEATPSKDLDSVVKKWSNGHEARYVRRLLPVHIGGESFKWVDINASVETLRQLLNEPLTPEKLSELQRTLSNVKSPIEWLLINELYSGLTRRSLEGDLVEKVPAESREQHVFTPLKNGVMFEGADEPGLDTPPVRPATPAVSAVPVPLPTPRSMVDVMCGDSTASGPVPSRAPSVASVASAASTVSRVAASPYMKGHVDRNTHPPPPPYFTPQQAQGPERRPLHPHPSSHNPHFIYSPNQRRSRALPANDVEGDAALAEVLLCSDNGGIVARSPRRLLNCATPVDTSAHQAQRTPLPKSPPAPDTPLADVTPPPRGHTPDSTRLFPSSVDPKRLAPPFSGFSNGGGAVAGANSPTLHLYDALKPTPASDSEGRE